MDSVDDGLAVEDELTTGIVSRSNKDELSADVDRGGPSSTEADVMVEITVSLQIRK